MILSIPEFALVLLIGPSGSGKSTFAHRHFAESEVVSSDHSRYLVADDANDQSATANAFALVHFQTALRLKARKLTVIDATSVQTHARRPFFELAREHDCPVVGIVFDMTQQECAERNLSRPDRDFPPHVLRRQRLDLQKSIATLEAEGFHQIYALRSPEEMNRVSIERVPSPWDRRFDHGPFDIFGDVHGCYDELCGLLDSLGYQISTTEHGASAKPPENRKAVFLGDLIDRGPKSVAVLKLVMNMVADGSALCVPGNHDIKLLPKLKGRDVQDGSELGATLSQIEEEPAAFKTAIVRFFESLPSHYLLNNGNLIVAHAGMKSDFQGRDSKRVRAFALYGETTGEKDEFGLPVRLNWAADYRGLAMVVYGHTPVGVPAWLNHTVNIDTGCVFGGRLTALRYPERQFLSVPAHRVYYRSAKPFPPK